MAPQFFAAIDQSNTLIFGVGTTADKAFENACDFADAHEMHGFAVLPCSKLLHDTFRDTYEMPDYQIRDGRVFLATEPPSPITLEIIRTARTREQLVALVNAHLAFISEPPNTEPWEEIAARLNDETVRASVERWQELGL